MRWLCTLLCFGFLSSVASVMASEYKTAVLAGGCFWCLEHDLKDVRGVLDVRSGYSGGHLKNPAYEDVSQGDTGHVESVEVVYDPNVLSYENLLQFYWTQIDPFDAGGQFCDRGPQYRAVVFVRNAEEREIAEQVKESLTQKLGQPIVTEILEFTHFYPAEDYHQDYAEKNPTLYSFYRWNCGRDQRIRSIWK